MNAADDTSMAARFATFDINNPRVWELFERFAFDAVRAGMRRFSSDAILHRIRWHARIDTYDPDTIDPETDQAIKIANNWSPYYARKFAAHHPDYADLFAYRTLRS